MRGPTVLVVLALPFVGCAQSVQDRAREISDDGLHLYRQGAYADARETFRSALALRPHDPDLIYNIGRCHDRLGQGAEAERYYHQVLQHAPDHLEARHAIHVRLVENGQRDRASRMVQEWLRQSPGLAGPYIEDAWLRGRDGDLDSARGRLQQALDLEPRHPRALVELARIYEKLDRPDRAVVLYERSLEVDADQPAIAQHVQHLRTRGVGRPRPD